jgi:hypothetical protein
MKILTLQGTTEQIANLMQCISSFDKDRLPTISKITTSERNLKEFLKFMKQGSFEMELFLRCQGGTNIISTSPINICTVKIDNKSYEFGGISEGFYDKMVRKYDKNDKIK